MNSVSFACLRPSTPAPYDIAGTRTSAHSKPLGSLRSRRSTHVVTILSSGVDSLDSGVEGDDGAELTAESNEEPAPPVKRAKLDGASLQCNAHTVRTQ